MSLVTLESSETKRSIWIAVMAPVSFAINFAINFPGIMDIDPVEHYWAARRSGCRYWASLDFGRITDTRVMRALTTGLLSVAISIEIAAGTFVASIFDTRRK
jgi:hypothetical protein